MQIKSLQQIKSYSHLWYVAFAKCNGKMGLQAEAQARIAELHAASQNTGMQISRVAELEDQVRQMEVRHQQMLQVANEHQQGATELRR